MPGDPIDGFGRELADIKRRLSALETAPKANNTAVRDGYTRWLLAAGDYPRVQVGASANEVDVGLHVFDDDGRGVAYFGTAVGQGAQLNLVAPGPGIAVVNVQNGVMTFPLISCAWQADYNTTVDTGGRPIVTSASYVATHRTVLPITSGRVGLTIYAFPGSGNTMDLKVEVENYFAPGTPSLVAQKTGITGIDSIADFYAVPTALNGGDSPIGMLGLFTISARRTAGAGNTAVAPARPIVNVT